jgi:predicted ribosome quality control (RQC) complex YloA/Tae2 family protein
MVNFRQFKTSSGKLVLAGKSAETNEQLVAQIASEEFVLHTKAPGSPFVNIKGEAGKEDLKEAAVFCARYSQDWRDNKKDVIINYFKGKNIHKSKLMKTGTFGVKSYKTIKIKKEDIEKFII